MSRTTRYLYKKANKARLYNVVLSLIEWELPATCNPYILERDLLTGPAALFWDDGWECFLNTSVTAQGGLDVYGAPTVYNCRGIGYQRTMPRSAIALCYNSVSNMPNSFNYWDINAIIDYFAGRLADMDICINNEIESAKHPAIIAVGDPKTEKSVRESFRQTKEGEPVVVVDEQLFSNARMVVSPINRNFTFDEQQKAKLNIFNEFLTYIGVDSLIYDKSDRLITSETTVNQQSISLPLQSMLVPRMECCREFYNLYGVKISVKPRTLNAPLLYGQLFN